MKRYLLNVLIAIDQLGCVLIGGFPDETLSSYAYRMREQGKRAGFFADWIDAVAWYVFKQPAHCQSAYLDERLRVEEPPELRGPV